MKKKSLIITLLGIGLLAFLIKYSGWFIDSILLLKGITTPLLLGCVIAYILNILVCKIESLGCFSGQEAKLAKIKRPISILCSLGIIFAIIALIIQIVIPQLLEAIGVLAKGIPAVISQLSQWLASSDRNIPQLESFLNSLNLNWPQLIQKTMSHLTSGLSELFTSTIALISSLGSFIINMVVAIIFSIYLLSGREQLFRQFRTVAKTYIKEKYYSPIALFFSTAHDTFTRFIIGQVTEAVIIGILCTLGMFLLRFPYASMVGTLIGATALIPVVGAYLGAFIGAFMIFTVSPLKALGFLLFIVILQQLEGNLIYPKVVGSSVGLPGIWVLAAVTIGGGVGGIVGMLIAVPITATFYKLLQRDVRRRNTQLSQG